MLDRLVMLERDYRPAANQALKIYEEYKVKRAAAIMAEIGGEEKEAPKPLDDMEKLRIAKENLEILTGWVTGANQSIGDFMNGYYSVVPLYTPELSLFQRIKSRYIPITDYPILLKGHGVGAQVQPHLFWKFDRHHLDYFYRSAGYLTPIEALADVNLFTLSLNLVDAMSTTRNKRWKFLQPIDQKR